MKITGHSRSRVFSAARVLAVLLLVFSLPAWARNYHISKFDSTIHVEEDGAARVEEKITFVFNGIYQGIYRDIPVDYPGPGGSNYTLFVKVLSVTDDNGDKLKVEKKTSNGFLHLKVFVPGATDATRTVNIQYSVANGTRFFEDHDEFYWNVTGNDWPVPIEQASATIYFPAEASGKLRAQAFEGIYGSSEHASASVMASSATVEARDPLPMRGGLTADIYIEKGVLHQPGAVARFFRFVRSNPVLTLPLWAFAVMFPMWWVKGRDPDPGISVAPMYEPPEQMGPAEVGTLIDGSVDPRDITSVLVDMAVRGYVKIMETQHKGFLSSTKDYEFHLLKDPGEWKGLTDYERAMLQQVFAGGEVTLLSSLTNHFYTALPMIKSEIMTALKAKGMYTVDPDSAAGYLGLGFLLVALPYAALQVMGVADFLNSVPMAIGCGLIAVGIILIIGKQLTATSLKGARTQVQIKGFQEFMNRVDADRLKRMPPDTFEKFLPYAMALGVEHRWAKAFEGIIQNPPTWYQGSYGSSFSTFYFVNSMGSMATTASSTFVSAPRASSSGSGWSGGGGGGGFSGGGFGGGGGGAF
ncbi:MAG TPA: DUF2207 domain-containing protein [Candidatus Angelobacter sp.]